MSHLSCDACNGYGYIEVVRTLDGRAVTTTQRCRPCRGTGHITWR